MHTKERMGLSLRGICFLILLTAVSLRLASGTELAALLPQVSVVTEEAAPAAPAEPTEESVELIEATEETAPFTMVYSPPHRSRFTAAEAALAEIKNKPGVSFDAEALLRRPISMILGEEPVILIVHTHATEAYIDSPGYRTEDTERNVVRVGQALADTLNAAGIPTLHDTSLNDSPDYNAAYARMDGTIRSYLEDYPSLSMVIDLHRDAAQDAAGNQVPLVHDLDGTDYANLMLVMGTDEGERPFPNWQDNLAMALKLQVRGEETASGMFRPISLRSARYNEHFTPNSILVEVGAAGNTLEQAIRSAEWFGALLSELLWEECGRS